MLLRKPLPLWIGVSLFAVSVAAIPLANRLLRQSDESPRTLTELRARLSRCTPPLIVVPQFPDRTESSMWVCTRPQSREQLWGQIRNPDWVKTGKWQGVVFCEQRGTKSSITDEFIHDNWGEYGMRIGRFVFFDDPDLLQRIRDALLDH
jgi:hypothetical protein